MKYWEGVAFIGATVVWFGVVLAVSHGIAAASEVLFGSYWPGFVALLDLALFGFPALFTERTQARLGRGLCAVGLKNPFYPDEGLWSDRQDAARSDRVPPR